MTNLETMEPPAGGLSISDPVMNYFPVIEAIS